MGRSQIAIKTWVCCVVWTGYLEFSNTGVPFMVLALASPYQPMLGHTTVYVICGKFSYSSVTVTLD